MYRPSTNTSSGDQFSISRGRKCPRSSMSTRFPDEANVWAKVPPPAPLPMMMTSNRSGIRLPFVNSSDSCRSHGRGDAADGGMLVAGDGHREQAHDRSEDG